MFIYGLIDPRSGCLRYVGQTNDLARRMRGHMDVRLGKSHKICWIRGLLQHGHRPEQVVLEEVANASQADEAERFWIASLRASGALLLNLTDGADSPMNRPEVVAKIRAANLGRKHDDATKKMMSKTRKGRPHSIEHRANLIRSRWPNSKLNSTGD